METLLSKLGLHRSELRAWAFYDWANSAMVTTIVTAIFPIYYSSVAGANLGATAATFRFGISTTIGLAIIALSAPVLGAIADHAGIKKRMLGAFLGVGVAAVAFMYLIQQGDWLLGSVLFILANIGANGSFIFYDSLLPHVARPDEMDRVSTAGYALGYIGGGVLLALNLAWIQKPAWFGLPSGPELSPSQATLPTRLAFVSVAAWWLLFSIPLFRNVREPVPVRWSGGRSGGGLTAARPPRESLIAATSLRLRETFRGLRCYKQATLMLLAFLIYNDGIGTIIRMAAIYGTEIGIGKSALIGSILLVQFVGVPFAFLFGALAGRIGTRGSIFIGLAVYAGVSILGYFMTRAWHFLLLAVLVGMVQGGTQALSRSLFASMIPRHRSAEFFSFFAVVEKFAGIFGPALFSLAIAATGSSRNAILSVILFFLAGGTLLYFVNVNEGRQLARSAEAASSCSATPGSPPISPRNCCG